MYVYRNYPKKFVRKLTFEQVKKKTLLQEDKFDEEAFYKALEQMEN